MNHIKRKLIGKYLMEFKKEISKGHYTLIPRAKNIDFLKAKGLTIESMEDIIFDLSLEDYEKGPEEDRGTQEGEIWVFKYNLDGELIYIKINYDPPSEMKIISFHHDI